MLLTVDLLCIPGVAATPGCVQTPRAAAHAVAGSKRSFSPQREGLTPAAAKFCRGGSCFNSPDEVAPPHMAKRSSRGSSPHRTRRCTFTTVEVFEHTRGDLGLGPLTAVSIR